MKRRFLGALALTIGMMTLASCGSKTAKGVQAEAEPMAEAAIEQLSFDSVVVDTATTMQNGADTLRATVHIQLLLAKGPGADMVNDSIMKSGIFMPEYMPKNPKGMTPQQQVNAFAKNFLKGYLSDCEEIKKQGIELHSSFSYSYDVTAKVEQNTADSLANYLATGYVFMGGAHGSSFSIARNFNLNNGKQWDKQSLLKTGSEKPVMDIVYQGILKSFGAEADNIKDMLFFGDKPYLTGNFIVKPDTITFIYQQDEIAPHACGEIQVPVSKKALANYLK